MKRKHDKHSPRAHANSADATSTANPPASGSDGVQGEGNYEAARQFDEAERKFVEAGRVAPAARAAAPKTDAEKREMLAAEEEGKRRAKK